MKPLNLLIASATALLTLFLIARAATFQPTKPNATRDLAAEVSKHYQDINAVLK